MQKWEEMCLERQWAREQGHAEGHAEGYKLAKIEDAKKMLSDNLTIEMIVRYTGLSEEEVLELK